MKFKKDSKRSFDVTCPNCKSVKNIKNENDMHAVSQPWGVMDDIDIGYAKNFYSTCSKCGNEIRIPEKSISKKVKSKIKTICHVGG